MAKRCPLCQGKLQNGECVSCGYRPPDEEDISALYNYDPSDYPQPEEEHIREITPDVQMEEIYPNRPDPIEIKVRNSQGKTIGNNGQGSGNSPYGQQGQQSQNPKAYVKFGRSGGGNSPYGQQGNPYYQNGNSPYGQQGQQGNPYYQNGKSPYGQQGQQGNPYYQNGKSPYGQQGQYGKQGNPYYQSGNSPYNQQGQYNGSGRKKNQPIDNFNDLMKTYWWLALLCFLIPPFGIMSFIIGKNTIDKKFHWIFILLTVIGFFRFI